MLTRLGLLFWLIFQPGAAAQLGGTAKLPFTSWPNLLTVPIPWEVVANLILPEHKAPFLSDNLPRKKMLSFICTVESSTKGKQLWTVQFNSNSTYGAFGISSRKLFSIGKEGKRFEIYESHRLTSQRCLHKVVLHGQWMKCIQQLFFLNLIFRCILSFTTGYSGIIHDAVSWMDWKDRREQSESTPW